ncbi:hypothetical protein [Nonomuraea dietziae]|uniref:hypothetical protein n=1 Tax=Nonomuraea dietziae TaxID=65515 RepID=UPI0031DDDEC0
MSVDDALSLFDLLMATKLPARAGRDEEKAAPQAESASRATQRRPIVGVRSRLLTDHGSRAGESFPAQGFGGGQTPPP